MSFNKTTSIIVTILVIALIVGTTLFVIRRFTQTAVPGTIGNKNQNIDVLSGINSLGSNQSKGKVTKTGATYKTVTNKPSGWFTTGQDGDLLLSGIDFNNTGGGQLYNHQGGIASDGKHLLVADRNNNRVLIWDSLPQGNTKPDLVLGQKDFTTNNPGSKLDGLNWPVAVATDGTHVIVADTYNDRVLIWNSFPTKNNQPADLVLTNGGSTGPTDKGNDQKRTIVWPWAVWTNGEKLVVTSTQTGSVLIWNSFPTKNDQPADIVLKAQSKFGTPRSIASNGKNLMIGDHNAKENNGKPGNFFWKTFPTKDDQPFDFFIAGATSITQGGRENGEIFWGGAFTPEGKFITIAESLAIWEAFPQKETDRPTMTIGTTGPSSGNGFKFMAGDGSGVALAGTSLYISTTNANKIVVYKNIPTTTSQKPDFAIGSPDINTNTLDTNFIMSNPVPETDGKSLFISSDFDSKLYVYKNLPDQANAHPDFVYPYGGWDNALYKNTFAEANTRAVYIWKTLPTNGNDPDIILDGKIGTIQFQEVKGVAIDEKYFYLSDAKANKIYIFEGVPTKDSAPKFTLDSDEPLRLSSDGRYLVVANSNSNETGHVRIYQVDKLQNNAQPQVLKFQMLRTNLPQSATVSHGSLFIADTGFNRVLVWKKIEDALASKQPDVILGQNNMTDTLPAIGKNKAFWSSNTAFDGSFLWVGEFKFSERLIRYSVH